ncbi:MAG: hypothetical protein ABI113_05575 [Mucilaginibacter sp.]
MKKYTLLLTMCIVLGFYACKKDNAAVNSGKLAGKWHETKLNLHETNGGVAARDTTFKSDSFTDLDFYQFNSDKTAVISRSGNFYFGGKAIVLNADVLFDFVTHYTYSVADSTVALKVTDVPVEFSINSNGEPYNQSQTIVQLDANNLVLRTTYTNMAPGPNAVTPTLVTTRYFTRVK